MGLSAEEIVKNTNNSNLPIGLVLMDIFEDVVTKETFPNAFDVNGNMRLQHKVNAEKLYQTYCPIHDEQENGDSFTVYTKSKTVHCYNGDCPLHNGSFDIFDCVSIFVFKMDPKQRKNREYKRPFFWKSARWLIKNYGDIIDMSLEDLNSDPENAMSDEKYKEMMINRIRKATVEYQNFLIHNTDKGKQAKEYLWEHRGLKYGVVETVDEIIDHFMLGVAYSDYKNPRLFNYLLNKKGFKKEDIIASKVCNEYEGGNIGDAFKAKFVYLTFPTIYKGKYGTIAGRNIDINCKKEDRHYKLHGSTELPAGMDSLHDAEEFGIVEGEGDKVSAYAMGLKHVMEARGTNGLKPEYIEYIAEIRKENPDKCRKCYLIYDPDGPGRAAVEITGRRLVDINVEVVVVRLPKVEVVVDGEKKMKYLDPNDLMTTYKENCVAIFNKHLKEAISYDAFMLLYRLEKAPDLSTDSAIRMAFKRNREHIDGIPKDELIFIMEEVLDVLEQSGKDRSKLEKGLKWAWFGEESKEESEQNPGFEVARMQSWLMVTDDEAVYNVWKKQLKLPNAVHILDAELFVKELKNSSITKNITFDQNIDKQTGRYLWTELKGFNLTLFKRPQSFQDFDRSQIPQVGS